MLPLKIIKTVLEEDLSFDNWDSIDNKISFFQAIKGLHKLNDNNTKKYQKRLAYDEILAHQLAIRANIESTSQTNISPNLSLIHI